MLVRKNYQMERMWQEMYMDCVQNKKSMGDWEDIDQFEKWWNENYYTFGKEKMYLSNNLVDKHTMVYSPETCVFIPRKIHNLFGYRNASYKKRKIGNTPIGVTTTHSGKSFLVQIRNPIINEIQYVGTYDDAEQAFYAFKAIKESIIQQMANRYIGFLPPKVMQVLLDYKVEIDD